MVEEVKHVGFKTLGMVLGLILGAIFVVFDVFKNWLTAGDIWVAAFRTLSGFAVLVILVPAITYLSHILWKYAYAIEEHIGKVEKEK